MLVFASFLPGLAPGEPFCLRRRISAPAAFCLFIIPQIPSKRHPESLPIFYREISGVSSIFPVSSLFFSGGLHIFHTFFHSRLLNNPAYRGLFNGGRHLEGQIHKILGKVGQIALLVPQQGELLNQGDPLVIERPAIKSQELKEKRVKGKRWNNQSRAKGHSGNCD